MSRAMKFAIKSGLRRDPINPFRDMERYEIGEHHSWAEEEIAQFEAHWAASTRERLVFDLLLYTCQRIGDVFQMTPADMGEDGVAVVQQKTKAKLWIPIHPSLRLSLGAAPVGQHRLMTNKDGSDMGHHGTLEKVMADAIDAAGLPSRCVPHGLRKAACVRLAEAGCTAHEIRAISGHSTLAEVERYTRAASQKMLAQSAMRKLTA